MIVKKFTPANGTVMVLRDEIKEKKVGSLYVADRAIELANEGEVRASEESCQYQPGDRVVFTKYAGAGFELNGVEYILLKEKEIQGKVTEHEVESINDAPLELPTSEAVDAAVQEALAKLQAESR